MSKQHWNKCDDCGKFIAYLDFDSGKAERKLLTPSSHFTREEYETLCKKCAKKAKASSTCKHETAIVSHSIRGLGLTQMICTWRCRQVFWMLQTGQVTKEISGEKATALIKAHNRRSG